MLTITIVHRNTPSGYVTDEKLFAVAPKLRGNLALRPVLALHPPVLGPVICGKRGISSILWRGKRGPRLAILPQPIGDSTISSPAIGNQESQRNLGPVERTAP